MTNNIFNKPNMIIVCGRSEQGKSYLVRYLLSGACERKSFKFGLVFCLTKFNNAYNFLPDNSVVAGYDEGCLKRYMNKLKNHHEKNGECPPNFIIFDDILGSLKNSDLFKEFISTYRHYNTTVFIVTQYLKYISTLGREQISYLFCFSLNTNNSMESLYDCIGGDFENKREFAEYIKQLTNEEYKCLMYSSKGRDIEDKFKSFKAPSKLKQINFNF